ncbi:MAG: response regulator, partial [Pseudomonadota bacterium]|nr:response regulator [Pseudomonadota bacterium]
MSEDNLCSVHIRVVEDEAFSLEAIRKVLNNIGATSVATTSNGAEALKLLEDADCNLDLIICDIEMPERPGYEFVRMLHYGTVPRLKDLPVLMLTGHDTPKNLRHTRTHRIDGFFFATADDGKFAPQHHGRVESLALPKIA